MYITRYNYGRASDLSLTVYYDNEKSLSPIKWKLTIVSFEQFILGTIVPGNVLKFQSKFKETMFHTVIRTMLQFNLSFFH